MAVKRLLKLLISLLLHGWDLGGGLFRKLSGRESPASCVVLYYHAVADQQRGEFARQMDILLRLAKPISADHQTPLAPGQRYAAVTFDDGFVSVIQNALPELQDRSIPATIFVPTGSLGRSPLWITDPSSPSRKETVLSAEELKGLNGTNLLTIGSHSVNHPNFLKSEPAQARAELVESKSTLEQILGSEVVLFSFPHGAHNEPLLQQAKEAGYRRVFTIEPTPAFRRTNEFAVGRTLVDPSDWSPEFRLKLLGAYRWLAPVSAWKARRLRN
jgi:peptidoglycan/xylan/chitin deacetylase (PgdA/CDA1 family)